MLASAEEMVVRGGRESVVDLLDPGGRMELDVDAGSVPRRVTVTVAVLPGSFVATS